MISALSAKIDITSTVIRSVFHMKTLKVVNNITQIKPIVVYFVKEINIFLLRIHIVIK